LRRVLTSLTFACAAAFAVLALLVIITLPPRSARLTAAVPSTVIYGAYHVHTSRSDGTGTVDSVAAAAARAGLTFVIFTDHGDATRAPDPPTYRNGVLCLDAVEIGSTDGHIVALNLRRASPYPIAGSARDVVDDIHRLGGWAVAAHPDSPNADLRFRGGGVPIDGIEWVNADSEWRDDTRTKLLAVAARSFVRAPESIASLFSRPVASLQRWGQALRSRPVFTLAAVDAHASIPWLDREEPRRRSALPWPSYTTMFRALSQAVILDTPPSGDATSDASRIWSAIGAGHTFSITRALASPATLTFDAERGGVVTPMGGEIEEGAPAPTLRAAVPGVPEARVTILRNGLTVVTGQGSAAFTAAPPGVYHAEVFYPGSVFPWLLSNAIRVGLPDTQVTAGDPEPVSTSTIPLSPDGPWHTEPDTGAASFEKLTDGIQFTFHLAPGTAAGQYAAVTGDFSGDAGIDRVMFTARATRPMRVSLQVRLRGGNPNARWRRSFYIDETPRPISILIRDLEPVDTNTSLRPIVARVMAVLVVVDTLNSLPGTEGTIWLTNVRLGVGDVGSTPER
jgi:hypothetical protein